jgi:hypothetical protein
MNPKASFRVHTLRCAGLFPIAVGDWIIQLTNFNALRFLKVEFHYNWPIPLRNWSFTIKICQQVSSKIKKLILTFTAVVSYLSGDEKNIS